MWRSLVVLALAAAVSAHDDGPLGGIRAATEPRLGASGIRIAVLEKQVEELDGQIDAAAKINPSGFIEEMQSLLDRHEGDDCSEEMHVQCGRESVECISSLLLCDGHNDCHNGWDESSETCSAGVVAPGNIFTGTATWDRCLTREAHPVKVHITGAVRSKFFGARMKVFANVEMDFVEDEGTAKVIQAKGYYVFGKKTLVLIPRGYGSGEHLGVVCHFHTGYANQADCHIVHEATLSECASFRAVLQ